MSDIEIAKGYLPGIIGRVAELHGIYYSRHWGFGSYFESKVATELAEFINRYDDTRDGIWTACLSRRIEGSIAVDALKAADPGAHLRWFIVSDQIRGGGTGHKLINAAIDFCRQRGYEKIYLWTFEGLDAAKHIYEWSGFKLVEERKGTQWGKQVTEQRFELKL
jgi:GNAT superfamily N-acetyltransferase